MAEKVLNACRWRRVANGGDDGGGGGGGCRAWCCGW
jgi:hypothetical protein